MDGKGASSESSSSNQLEKWTEEQDRVKKKLITHDDFPWKLPSSTEHSQGSETLKYVGGVDISFSKDDSSVACACLVVLELPSLRVVHNELSLIRLQVPYVPGFLAFREAPVLLQILEKMRDDHHPFYPQFIIKKYLRHDMSRLQLQYPRPLMRDTTHYMPLLKTNLVSHALKDLTASVLGYDIQLEKRHTPSENCVASMRLYKRMRNQQHGQATEGKGLASYAPRQLNNMSVEHLYTNSVPNYYCWCHDRHRFNSP